MRRSPMVAVGLSICVVLAAVARAEATPLAAGPTTAATANAAAKRLVGRWQMIKDDDKPGAKPPAEIIAFRANGTYRVEGSGEPFDGRYRVEGEEVVMTVVIEGNTKVMRRRFKLDTEGLHFANPTQGFAHYVPVK